MSDCFDHGDDAWDSLLDGRDDFTDCAPGYYHKSGGYRRPSKTSPKCRECGTGSVHWDKVASGKWCLHDNGSMIPHVCKPKVIKPVLRTGKNSNMKEITGYRLVSIKSCGTCISHNKTRNRDHNIISECTKHEYSVIENALCNDWEKDE